MDQHLSIFPPTNQLKRLRFVNALSQQLPPSSSSHHPPIAFPHLVEIDTYGTARDYTSFKISCTDKFREETYTLFQPWLSNIWRPQSKGLEAAMIHAFTCTLTWSAAECLLLAQTNTSTETFAHLGCQHTPSIEWTWISEDEITSRAFMRWAMQHLPLSECLRFDSNLLTDPEIVRHCSNHMRRVEHLHSDRRLNNYNMGALMIPDGTLCASDLLFVPFLALTTLEIDDGCTEEEWNELHSLLQNRREGGYALKRVSVVIGEDWGRDRLEEVELVGRGLDDHFSVICGSEL